MKYMNILDKKEETNTRPGHKVTVQRWQNAHTPVLVCKWYELYNSVEVVEETLWVSLY